MNEKSPQSVADAFASGKRRERDEKLAELMEVFSRFGYVAR